MRGVAIVWLVATLCQTVTANCHEDRHNMYHDQTSVGECRIRINKTCHTERATQTDVRTNKETCQVEKGNLDCYCSGRYCNKNKWIRRKQFEIYFEDYFKKYGQVHKLAACRNGSEAYEIGKHYKYFEVQLCSVRIKLDKNGVCSSTQQCFLNTRLALPECSSDNGVVTCYCQDRKDKQDCTETGSLLTKVVNYNPIYANNKLKSCAANLTTKWTVINRIPKTDQSYECYGKHVGGWNGLKVCALLLRKNDDGSCELEQQSRSVPANVASYCQDDGYDVICFCLGNHCNAYENNFKFEIYFKSKGDHAAKPCLKMITHKVMSARKIKRIGAHSYECAGVDNHFWKDGNTICGVMLSMDGGVCHLKQISRSVDVKDQKVPDCQNENGNLLCFCLGENCNQEYNSFFEHASFMAAEKFYRKEYVNTGKVPQLEECRMQTNIPTGKLDQIVVCGFGFNLGGDSEPNCDMVKDVCFASYAPGVPGCWQSGTAVRCFCGGMSCYENTVTIMEMFGAFYGNSENHNHETKRCYMKMIATTTVTTPSTTEQLTSTAETTVESTTESTIDTSTDAGVMTTTSESSISYTEQMDEDTSTTNGISTAAKPVDGISESDSSSTTRKDILTGTKEDDEQTIKTADSSWPIIIGIVAFVVLIIVVIIIIGCCVWYRKNKKKKPERVIEVVPIPFVGPLPKPPTPATPTTTATAATSTTSATNENPAMSGKPETPGDSATPGNPATSGNSATSGTTATSETVAISGKPATSRKRAAPAAPAGPVRKRRKLTPEEIIAKKIAKQRRRAELKKKAEIPEDVLSDRHFQKKGPLHIINVQKELPDDPLPSSVDLSGTGKMEFDDKGNEIFLLGTDIEIIDDSIRTQRTQDKDDVEATQDEDEPKKEGKASGHKKKKKNKKRSTGTGKKTPAGTGQKKHHKKRKRSKNRAASKNP